jgi:hypothetical protein
LVLKETPRDLLDKAFEPYAKAIGYFLRDWNDLQEQFSRLFLFVVGNPDPDIFLAIWHSIPNDRMQRGMLRAAAARRFMAHEPASNKGLLEEINWLLEKADSLGRQRDDAAHVPVALLIDEPFEFIAHALGGNPMAKKLKGKRLLDEFNLYRQRAKVLRSHATQIELYLSLGRTSPLPKTPAWPNPPPSSGDKSQRQQGPGRGR